MVLEALLRTCDDYEVTAGRRPQALATWNAAKPAETEIPFKPARVVLQDFTGVPCVVDLAAMRAAMKRLGGDPKKINPLVPVDLVIDHSVQVDFFGAADSLEKNVEIEFDRNAERYAFLRWGQQAFRNFRVVPPAIGIVHQVNLEYLAGCVFLRDDPAAGKGGLKVAVPDTLVGTDSHTTMINGLGVVGWGVGGIEAEAVMLGQALSLLLPGGGRLRAHRAGCPPAPRPPISCSPSPRSCGRRAWSGSSSSSSARASPACRSPTGPRSPTWPPNTAPRWASSRSTTRRSPTCGSPAAGRRRSTLVERYMKEQGLFRTDAGADAGVHEAARARPRHRRAEPRRAEAAAGPRAARATVKQTFAESLTAPTAKRGFALDGAALARTGTVQDNGHSSTIGHGAVVIAAITSCTNTSNPSVMVAAGLVARKAVAKGLTTKPWVKTSLAPGSRVVTDYLEKSGLDQGSRRARLRDGGLRLHDLHRQLRAAARQRGEGRHARAISWPPPCSPATATSRAASTRS